MEKDTVKTELNCLKDISDGVELLLGDYQLGYESADQEVYNLKQHTIRLYEENNYGFLVEIKQLLDRISSCKTPKDKIGQLELLHDTLQIQIIKRENKL